MQSEFNAEDIGGQLGAEGVQSVVTKVEEYCAYEIQRIALTNEPQIMALRAEGALLLEEERGLRDRLRDAPPPGDRRTRLRKAVYAWGVTAVLAVAGFVFSLVAFDPFRLGWKSYVYSVGIAAVTPFLVEKVIAQWNAERLLKWFAALACAAALASLVLLAVVRGDLLIEQFKNANTPIVIDDALQSEPPQTNFYGTTLVLLRLVMALLALAMELGAGLALYDAWRLGAEEGEDWNHLRARLNEVRGRLTSLTFEITALENEPGIFAAQFWRNFYHAMLANTVRSAMTKLLLIVFVVTALLSLRAAAEDEVTIVVALDLTQSVAATAPDKKTEFQKNIDGITRLLAALPAASRVTVMGITDRSFSEPYILLTAAIPRDPGYFGERLQSARNTLVRAWKTRSKALQPQYRSTDILGAFLVAGQIFDASPRVGRKILVVFSDMRESTSALDFESLLLVPGLATLRKKRGAVPSVRLRDVEVFILGVDGAGKSVPYWQSLQRFWTEYLEDAGARVRRYSVLRELPAMEW